MLIDLSRSCYFVPDTVWSYRYLFLTWPSYYCCSWFSACASIKEILSLLSQFVDSFLYNVITSSLALLPNSSVTNLGTSYSTSSETKDPDENTELVFVFHSPWIHEVIYCRQCSLYSCFTYLDLIRRCLPVHSTYVTSAVNPHIFIVDE